MAEATQEMIALAREIVAGIVEGDIDNTLRVAQANAYLSGRLDGNLAIQIALAAIQATTERAAKLADGWNAKRRDRATETGIAAALRDGDHLKEQSA